MSKLTVRGIEMTIRMIAQAALALQATNPTLAARMWRQAMDAVAAQLEARHV